jgi:hypothetical protein
MTPSISIKEPLSIKRLVDFGLVLKGHGERKISGATIGNLTSGGRR